MNKIHCISYVDGPYLNKKSKLESQMSSCGWFDTHKVHTSSDLPDPFRQKYRQILSMGRGAGYWIWKPLIIRDYLMRIPDNDILIYMDGGCTIINTAEAYARLVQYKNLLYGSGKDMIRFEIKPHTEIQYTNTTTLNYFKNRFGLQINENNDIQLMATIIIMIKNTGSLNYFDTLLNIINDDPLLITDHYNSVDKHPQFIDHRHDQSLCSLLTKSLNNGLIIPDDTWYPDFTGINNVPILATRKNI